MQDSHNEACSEVAEVPDKGSNNKNTGRNEEQSRFCVCFWERSYFIDIDRLHSNKNTCKKSKTTRFQALRQASAETAALSCHSDIQKVQKVDVVVEVGPVGPGMWSGNLH